MDAEAIRRYAGRAWDLIDAEKRAYWAKRYREEGPAPIRRAADGLREQLRAIRPDWPTPRDRDEDLAHHVALKRLLDAARDAFSGR